MPSKRSTTMLGAYGPWAAGLIPEAPGSLSFRSAAWTDATTWTGKARARVLDLLAPPAGVPTVPTVKTLRTFTVDGLAGEEVEWNLGYGPATRGLVLKPAGAKGRLPAVLALHDHGGNKYFGVRKITTTDTPQHPEMAAHQREYYGGRAWANELARRGYVVLTNDAFLFGSRRARPSDVPEQALSAMLGMRLGPEAGVVRPEAFEVGPTENPKEIERYNAFAGEHEHIVAKSLFCAGTTWPGVCLAEDQAALGVLCARSDVDPARVGCCGLSGGGLRADFLGGLDPRITCSVTVGWMTTWRDLVLDKTWTHTWMVYVPGLPPLMDFPEILSVRMPRPALVQNTRQDPLFTLSEAERCDRILRECYAKAGAADAFRMSFYDGPHKFDVPMQEEAFAWLARWLA